MSFPSYSLKYTMQFKLNLLYDYLIALKTTTFSNKRLIVIRMMKKKYQPGQLRNIFSGLIEDVDVEGSNAAAAKTAQPARALLGRVEHLPGFAVDVEFFLDLKEKKLYY